MNGSGSEIPESEFADESPQSRSFYARLPGALAYPLRGHGKYVILASAVLFWLLGVVDFLAGALSWSYLGIGTILAGVIACLVLLVLAAYALEVIGRSADGQEEAPDWPEITDWYANLLRPGLLILAAATVSFLPTVVYIAWSAAHWSRAPSLWALLLLGMLYFPMGAL